jgi:uncharacterized protein YqhQ
LSFVIPSASGVQHINFLARFYCERPMLQIHMKKRVFFSFCLLFFLFFVFCLLSFVFFVFCFFVLFLLL